MKGEAEIRRVLTRELGFRDLDAYKKWIAEARATTPLTPERIALLSPDHIDCRAFWRVCEELFGHDPVCNVAVSPQTGKLPFAIESPMDANRMNLRFAKSLGVTAFLDEFAHERVNTLEIGPGFGSLKNYIETATHHVYTGVDVFPRIPGVIEATADGLLPPSLVEADRGKFSYVVSSNVFQHLSAKQRTRYFHDVHTLLHKGGLFLFNLSVDTGSPGLLRDASGVAWCDHYGQYTLLPKPNDLQRELTTLYFILYVTQRYDGLFHFVCQKRQ
jgi:hypothetical protein